MFLSESDFIRDVESESESIPESVESRDFGEIGIEIDSKFLSGIGIGIDNCFQNQEYFLSFKKIVSNVQKQPFHVQLSISDHSLTLF